MLTTYPDQSNMCYVAGTVGSAIKCERNSGVKPVILLSGNALYDYGSGTVTDPYRIISYDDVPVEE